MNPEVMANFMEALGIMGKGMLGIFVVIVVIAVLVYLLTKISSRRAHKKLPAQQRRARGSAFLHFLNNFLAKMLFKPLDICYNGG